MSKRKLLYNTAILTLVNFILRFLGFFYKISISKHIGAEGVGLFQVISPVLTLAVTFTTVGIPIAVSRLISIQPPDNNLDRKKVLRTSLFINLTLSVIIGILVFIFSEYISYNILKNKDVYFSVLFLIPSIILISLNAVFRSYFYGVKKVSISGLSQIVEQIAKISFVLYIIRKIGPVNPKVGLFVCVIGMSVGEFISFLCILTNYFMISLRSKKVQKSNLRYVSIAYNMFKISLPITFSSILSSILNMLNSIIIPQRLILAGYTSKQALSIFGRAIGMTLPLIFLPFAVISPLVVNIIPTLSEYVVKKRYKDLAENVQICLQIVFMVSIPATLFFVFFGDEIGMFLYKDNEVGKYLSIMGFSTVFLSLQHILSGILQGIGREISSTINNLIGNIFQVACTYFLISNPLLGINGFFISFIIASIITTILNGVSIYKSLNVKFNIFSYVFKPLIISIICLSASIFTYNHFSFIISMSIGVVIYMILSLITNKKIFRFIKI